MNNTDPKGKAVLMHAAEGGHIHCVNILLKQGADVNRRDEYAQTALMYAAAHNHVMCLERLLETAADVNEKDYNMSTALIVASENGHEESVLTLLKHGAHMSKAWINSSLAAAAGNKNFEWFSILCKKGTVVKKQQAGLFSLEWDGDKSHEGVAVCCASFYGFTEYLDHLIKTGADVNEDNLRVICYRPPTMVMSSV